MGKRGSAPGKQNLRVTCPTGKVEFKYFLSPECALGSSGNYPSVTCGLALATSSVKDKSVLHLGRSKTVMGGRVRVQG